MKLVFCLSFLRLTADARRGLVEIAGCKDEESCRFEKINHNRTDFNSCFSDDLTVCEYERR
jgi:hypothetical protein